MSAPTVADIPVIEGREGLRIPDPEYEWEDRGFVDARYLSNNVLRFFRNLWRVNAWQFGQYDSVGKWYFDQERTCELSVPASGDKPLTVIRSNVSPRDPKAIEMERFIQKNSKHSSGSPIHTGTEKHGVYTPPDTLAPMTARFEAEYTHGGTEEAYVYHEGIWVSDAQLRRDSLDIADWDERRQHLNDSYTALLKAVLHKTVELLT